MFRILLPMAAGLFLVSGLSAQSIVFTGDVAADFGPAKMVADPGGLDVAVPAGMPVSASGWDVEHVAFSHDHLSDTLYVGIDVAGIAGDADGDGDPSLTSVPLAAVGGIDRVDFGGGETLALALDLNGDSSFDVIAGIPVGQDLWALRLCEYDATATGPLHTRFGTALPSHPLGLFASPSAMAPDLEFTIPNFSQLMLSHGQGSQGGSLGFEVFLGSSDDQGIGDDLVMNEQAVVTVGPCFPQPNLYENAGLGFGPGGIEIALRYHVMQGYGCCTIYSTSLAPIPITLTGLLGQPDLLIGVYGDPSSIIAIDNGVPDLGGLAVDCKDQVYVIPFSIPSGFEIHAQVLAYPAPGSPLPFLTSNTVTYVQP
jgi:hypothetical protein